MKNLPLLTLVVASTALQAQSAAPTFNYNTLTLEHVSQDFRYSDADFNVNTLTYSNRFAPNYVLSLGIAFHGVDKGGSEDIDSGYKIAFGHIRSLGADTDLILSLGVHSYDQTQGSSREVTSTRLEATLRHRLSKGTELRASLGREVFSEADDSGAFDTGSDRTIGSLGLAFDLELPLQTTLAISAHLAVPDNSADNTDSRSISVSLSFPY